MGNRLYDNDFEEFLREQTDQHRMYPSDHVWRNIYKDLHGYTQWPALTVIAIFIISALVIGTVATSPHAQFVKRFDPDRSIVAIAEEPGEQVVNTTAKNGRHEIPVSNFSLEKITQETIDFAKETVLKNGGTESLIINGEDLVKNNLVMPSTAAIVETAVDEGRGEQMYNSARLTRGNEADNSSLAAAIASYNIMRELQSAKAGFSNVRVNNNYRYFAIDNAPKDPELYIPQFNFDLEPSSKNNGIGSRISKIGSNTQRLDLQVYVTPSVSYRRLSDNAKGELSKSYISALPYTSNYVVDVNQVINHRPSTGFEVGFNLGYNLSKKVAVRSGFQFNMQQYKIDAFVHSFEPAQIALNGNNSNMVLNTVSTFRSESGAEPIELTNRYYQVSMPIGIDWRPVNGKFSWGLAAAVQPTYTFDKEPFIITSNYKNYADGSQLMRNWNVNANIETYIGYTAGKYRWQLGPQFRYQLMPTMSNSYPIKEHLFDYGLKLGLVRSLK